MRIKTKDIKKYMKEYIRRRYTTEPEFRKKFIAYVGKYQKSPKGKEMLKKYYQSKRYKQKRKEYYQTEKYKEIKRKYYLKLKVKK